MSENNYQFIDDTPDVNAAVFQALHEAAACWKWNVPDETGWYDAQKVQAIGEELLMYLERWRTRV